MNDISNLLAGLLVFQTIFFTLAIHRLLNKVMSKNFRDYQDSRNVMRKPKIKTEYIEPEPQQNLGMIADFR